MTGRQFLRLIFEAAGTPPTMGTLNRRGIRFFALLNVDAREVLELVYD